MRKSNNLLSPGPSFQTPSLAFSDIKTEMHSIAVLDYIFLAFKTHQAFFFGT